MSQCPPFLSGSKFVKLNTSTGTVLFVIILPNPHFEDQFLVCHGIYTDLNDDKWVKCNKCFALIMSPVSKKTPTLTESTSGHSWPVTSRSKCVLVLFFLVLIICFICFSMGHKGSNHPRKAKPEYSERAHHFGQSHWGQALNQWFKDNMEQVIREYHQLVFLCSLLRSCFRKHVVWYISECAIECTCSLHCFTSFVLDCVWRVREQCPSVCWPASIISPRQHFGSA